MSDLEREALTWAHICGTCHDVYEQDRPDALNQRCACGPREEPTWPEHDFNEHARLCLCCGVVAVRSGSRWSSFFCRECQLLAMGVSLWERRLVMPIGRHSLMHTWVPRTRPATPAAHDGDMVALAQTVVDILAPVFGGHEVLRRWSARTVAGNMSGLGLAGGVRVLDYLDAAANQGALPGRFQVFGQMCAFIRASAGEGDRGIG